MFNSRFFTAYFFDASFWGKAQVIVNPVPVVLLGSFDSSLVLLGTADGSQVLAGAVDSSLILTGSYDDN